MQKQAKITSKGQDCAKNHPRRHFPDAPLRGVFGRKDVYAGITGWDSFEPWLTRIEGL